MKKSRKTLTARGFYDFSEEYPDLASNNLRFRNSKKKTDIKALILIAVICLILFALAYVLTSAGLKISNEVPDAILFPRSITPEIINYL